MTVKQLERALSRIAPALQRALLAQLRAWKRQGAEVNLEALERAIIARDAREAVRLLLGEAVAATLPATLAPDAIRFPEASRAVSSAPAPLASPAGLQASSTTERELVRSSARAVREASRRAAEALPPAPVARVAALGRAPAPLTLTIGESAASAAPARLAASSVRYGGEALSYLRAEAAQAVAAAVQRGNAAGVNPREVARGLREVVGLGDSQAQWVENLREELLAGDYRKALERRLINGPLRSTLEARVRSGKALKGADIEKIVAQYADKWRAWHAETVARTMSLDLLREGTLARALEAQAAGAYGDRQLTKRWVTRLDGRERPAHAALHNRTIPIDATWNDDGVARRVPGGWNCRCAMVVRVGL